MKKVLLIAGVIFVALVILGGFLNREKSNGGRGVFSSPMGNDCTKGPLPEFSSHITEMDKVSLVQPGGDIENHKNQNIIKSHSYIVVTGEVPIFAPVKSIAFEGVNYMEEGVEQYSVFFLITCDVFYLFDHIHKPVDKLKKEFTKKPGQDTRTDAIGPVEFSAGELIGYTTGTRNAHHFDFGLYDMTKDNSFPGYEGVNISERDRWSICPFNNFPENLRVDYTSRFGMIRSQEEIPTSVCKH